MAFDAALADPRAAKPPVSYLMGRKCVAIGYLFGDLPKY
jgi:hypothetical protein